MFILDERWPEFLLSEKKKAGAGGGCLAGGHTLDLNARRILQSQSLLGLPGLPFDAAFIDL